MEKQYMTHDEFLAFIKEGYDTRGFRGKSQPLWHNKVYMMWRNMWSRCYDPNDISYHLYINSIIHDDFRLFSNYLKWIQAQPRFDEFCSTCHEVSWSVDKDKDNNKNYFPEYMVLCTKSENSKARMRDRGNPMQDKKVSSRKMKPIIGIKPGSILLFNSVNETNDGVFKPCNINNCLKRRQPRAYGYKWYYINYKHNKIYRVKGEL